MGGWESDSETGLRRIFHGNKKLHCEMQLLIDGGDLRSRIKCCRSSLEQRVQSPNGLFQSRGRMGLGAARHWFEQPNGLIKCDNLTITTDQPPMEMLGPAHTKWVHFHVAHIGKPPSFSFSGGFSPLNFPPCIPRLLICSHKVLLEHRTEQRWALGQSCFLPFFPQRRELELVHLCLWEKLVQMGTPCSWLQIPR